MSVTEELTPFEKELKARSLLTFTRKICRPVALRPDDLHRTTKGERAAAVVTNARAKLAKHLIAKGWSYPMIARLLGYPEHTTVMRLVKDPIPR